MPIDDAFAKAVAPLYRSTMGTELVAHLLYGLVRMTRPRRALEIGAGYTTPFLLRGLADNDHDDGLRPAPRRRAGGVRRDANLVPGYRSRRGSAPSVLDVVDDESRGDGSAGEVAAVARRLGLDRHLALRRADFRTRARVFARARASFDLVWFDCGGYEEYVDFLRDYWDLVNPAGGLLVMHSTLTNVAIRELVANLKLRQATTEFHDFELLSLLEPHKLEQNSVTMIRMTSRFVSPTYTFLP
jgi:predicted O-methyltransferase YrrM